MIKTVDGVLYEVTYQANRFVTHLFDIRDEVSYIQLGDTYVYKSYNGIDVTSCCAPEPDFKTVFHYMRFSYGSWVTKIRKAVKLDWTEKLQSVGILKPS